MFNIECRAVPRAIGGNLKLRNFRRDYQNVQSRDSAESRAGFTSESDIG